MLQLYMFFLLRISSQYLPDNKVKNEFLLLISYINSIR